jgi:glycosyltransferase involved in cell wall biosynthesis
MTKGSLVSIIIPTYNQEDFISETLESVLAQTYINTEIIVTDDGSTDRTPEILQQYASNFSKINLITSEKNTGVVKNINRALNVVNGEFIAWLGGDDLMMPEKIEKQVNLLMGRPDAVGCCHDAEVFESDSGKALGLFSEIYNSKKGFREGGIELLFDPGYHMLPSTIMFRSIYRPIEGFDERLLFGDWLYDIEIFRHGKCVVINEVLARYRRHSKNITGSLIAKSKGFEENLIILAIVDSKYPELHYFTKKMRKAFFIDAALASFRNGDILKSNSYINILKSEGAIIRAITIYISLRIFYNYISKEMSKERGQKSRLFVKISSLIRRGL